MKKRIAPFYALFAALCAVLSVLQTTVNAQFSTPTLDGVIGSNEYGVHVNGQNQQANGAQTWYMTWDDTNLYVAATNADTPQGAVLYIDARNVVTPPNGGTNADRNLTGQNYDGTNFSALPFRADFVAYFKDGYREYRTANGSGSSSSPITNWSAYTRGTGNIRELTIPWSAITGSGRPASFNFFAYVASLGGFDYAQVPAHNPDGNIRMSATYHHYFAVLNTGDGTSTKPFSLDSGPTLEVDRTDDPNPPSSACTAAANDCSLRGAIARANASAGPDTITFDPVLFNNSQTIVLTGGELSITDAVTLTGPGARNLTVSGNNQFRVFFINAPFQTVNISGLAVANGFADANHGGGIRNETNTGLNLTEVTVRNNTASGHGGGIINFGTMNIIRSTISYNTSPSNGGGINNQPGAVLNISNSTISNNTAAGSPPPYGNDGGGIINFSQLTLNNVTISHNTAQTNGGGISNQDVNGAVTNLRNTIIAGNNTTGGAAPDVSGTFNSLGDNLIGNTAGSAGFGAAGDILNQPANLGALQNNGGPTDTRELLPGSLAIDNGNNCVTDSSCPSNNPPANLTTDQRGTGFSRLVGINVDIGAFEVQNMPPVAQCRNVTVTLPSGQTTAPADINNGSYDPDGDNLMFTYNPPGPYPAGQTLVTLTVDDGKGGTASCTGTVTVQYQFKWFGYSDLLSNPQYFTQATAGSNIAVRFSLNGYKGDPYSQPPTSQPISCTTKAPLGPATVIDRYAPDPYYSSQYDFYQTTWRTQAAWKNTCRRLTLYFKDGSTQSLDYKFN